MHGKIDASLYSPFNLIGNSKTLVFGAVKNYLHKLFKSVIVKNKKNVGSMSEREEGATSAMAGQHQECHSQEQEREDSDDAAVEKLIGWAEAHGAVLQGVRRQGRRFYASQDLPAGHIVFSVPLSILMTTDMAFRDKVFGAAMQEIAAGGASDQIILTLFASLERAKGEGSFWAPYLAAIPTSFNTPLWFTDEELGYLQGTKVAASLVKDRASLEQLVKIWGPRLLFPVNTSHKEQIDEAMQLQSLQWARTAVQSRGFNLLLEGRRKEVLVPLFDMLDHSPYGRVAWLTDEEQCVFHFACDAALPASTEIFNNYGQKPNDELLQGYGFCLYPNDADLFYIRIGLTAGQESKAQLEPAKTLATEERGTPTAQARQELLWRMGVAAEYQLSLKDPLPKALFDSSLLCLQSEASAYMSSGIGWEVVSEISLAEGVATKIKVISALRKSLLNSSEKFVGGPAVDGDRQLLACWKQLRDADPRKKISSEREEFSVKYRLGQKEIVQAAMKALDDCASVMLSADLYINERQDWQSLNLEQVNCATNFDAKVKSCETELYDSWMEANDIKVDGLSEFCSDGGSRPALQLTKDSIKYALLVTVVEKLALCAQMAYNAAHPLCEVLSKMKGVEENLVLRLLLLYEFGRGSASAWAPFIKTLAYCMVSPICYSPELLGGLTGTGLGDRVSERLEDLHYQFENIFNPLLRKYPHLFPNEAGTLQRWLWADVVIEECSSRMRVVKPREAAKTDGCLDTTALVLAPLLSTLTAELEGALVTCAWDQSTGLLTVHSLCSIQAGCRLEVPAHELDNEACLLQLRPTVARVNNRNDVMELCIGVPPEDELAVIKEDLLQASGLGTAHYLTKDPKPDLLLAAVALCFIDSMDALEDCGASHLLVTVKDAKVAAEKAEEAWCTGQCVGYQPVTLDERRTQAHKAHALAAATASSFVRQLQEPSRSYKAAGTLSKLISTSYKSLIGGSAEDDQKKLQEYRLLCTPISEADGAADISLWRGVLAYRHGQKQIMEAWLSRLKQILKGIRGPKSGESRRRRDCVKRKR